MSKAGIRVELSVEEPAACPVASTSATTGEPVEDVVWTADGEDHVEEFSLAGEAPDSEFETVYADDEVTRYRFERDPGANCFCAAIEDWGPVVDDVTVSEGRLTVRFYAPDLDAARGVVDSLTDAYDGVVLRSLRREDDHETADPVVVDRGDLTDRQREVLATARDLGYFEYPKGANAGEVADALDISVSTLSEHLAAAQSKVLADLFD